MVTQKKCIFTVALATLLTFGCSGGDKEDDPGVTPGGSSSSGGGSSSSLGGSSDSNALGSCRDSEGGCMSFVTQDYCEEWYNGTFSLNEPCDGVEQCVDTQLFCHNTDGDDGCDPIPSYVTESECVSTPGASVKSREWCITNYKMYWCN